MSYFVADVNGFVGDLASGGGLHRLYEWMERQSAPLIQQLLEQGFTSRPADAASALEEAAGDTEGEPEGSARRLARLLRRCEEIGIITDGVGGDADSEGEGPHQ